MYVYKLRFTRKKNGCCIIIIIEYIIYAGCAILFSIWFLGLNKNHKMDNAQISIDKDVSEVPGKRTSFMSHVMKTCFVFYLTYEIYSKFWLFKF